MVYATPFPSLFIYLLVSIYCRDGFVLGSWKSIIIYFMANSQMSIYILLSSFVNRSLTSIGYDRKLPPNLLLFTIFKQMCLATLSDKSKPPLKSVQIVVSKLLMFHENTELLPSGDCYYLSPGNNYPTDHIMLLLVRIPVINQPDWVEVAIED